MKNSRAKGARGELAVAKLLQDWWRKFERASEFVRTPLSGGWHKGSQVQVDMAACGDITTNAVRFPFCVEVKYREQWSVKLFFEGKPTAPWQFWRQTIKAAEVQNNMVPMMWLRKNFIPGTRTSFPWLVLVPHDFYLEKRLSKPDVSWSEKVLLANGANFGGILPVAYDYQRFIEMDPRRMAAPKV